MTHQLSIPFDRTPAGRFAAWKQFHRANPHVFALFVRFAREAKAAGRERFGAHAIGERIRWYTAIETRSSDGLKINDHHLPYWSRLAMLLHPDLAGFFERRDANFDATDEQLLDAHRGVAA